MPILEAIAIKSAANLVANLSKAEFRRLSHSKYTSYEQELSKIILSSIKEFNKIYPPGAGGKIPFYESEIFFDELLKYRFTTDLDRKKILGLIQSDNRIAFPDTEMLQHFYELFSTKVNSSASLKELNLESNYKEQIFELSYFLKQQTDRILESIDDLKTEFRATQKEAYLIEEWNRQLDEILQNINSFKPKTALDRLELLEKRITAESVVNNTLFSRICFLKVQCLSQFEGDNDSKRIAELLIKAYRYQPANIDYKGNAGWAYVLLNESAKARKIADELLEKDEFDLYGWMINCFLAKENYEEVLEATPSTVKNKLAFKIQIYHWLNLNHYVIGISPVQQLGLGFEIDSNEDIKINAQNRQTQLIKVTYILNGFFEKYRGIRMGLFYPEAKSDPDFILAGNILDRVVRAVHGTEIEANHLYFEFQSYCCDFILNGKEDLILKMEAVFLRLKPKTFDTVIRMSQGYRSLKTKESILKAAEIVDGFVTADYDGLYFLNALNYAAIGDMDKSEDRFFTYVSMQRIIDRVAIVNILNFLRETPVKTGLANIKILTDLSDTDIFEKPIYKDLLKLAIYFRYKVGDLSNEDIVKIIETAKTEIEATDIILGINIAMGLCQINKFQEAKEYLEGKIDFSTPSEELKLYCKILYSIEGHKPELLKLLKSWRENFPADYELTEIELFLYQMQYSWEEAIAVAKYGMGIWPKSEKFIFSLFAAAHNAVNLEEIINNAHVVKELVFVNEGFVSGISSALIKASLFQEALDLLYRHACQKVNTKSRQAYIALSINFPPGLLKEYQTVEINSFVKYQIRDKTEFSEITQANKDRFPHNMLLGKNVGDVFMVTAPFTDVNETVRIIRICDKYLGLLEELMQDAENPLSGLGFQTFHLEDPTAEGIKKTFQDLFGARGSMEKERVANEFEKYYNGQLSFSEISNSVFRQHSINAYFTLSDKLGKGFKAITPFVSRAISISDDNNFILDITSTCLFFELSRDLGFQFKKKFIISKHLRNILVQGLEEVRNNPDKEISLSITLEGVTPHFYSDNFKPFRTNLFQSMIEWLDENCVIEEVPESLNYVMAVPGMQNGEPYFLFLVENRLMAVKDKYLLLTNDTIYYSYLQMAQDRAISPICYLENFHLSKRNEYLHFMLYKNYIGIPLSSEILTSELFKMLSDQDNRFTMCLENLRFNWNPDNRHISQVMVFVKSLYTSSSINVGTRQQIVATTFSNLVLGMPKNLILFINGLIKTEFKLLGIYLDEVMLIFKNSIL